MGSFLTTGRCGSIWSTPSSAGSSTSSTASSTAALDNRGQAHYSVAKAGLQGFTRTLAIGLGPFGNSANSVAPGFITIEMTAATAERLGSSCEEFKAAR
jgi:3-oxoacyl-[acyl-carrier protein] reductase